MTGESSTQLPISGPNWARRGLARTGAFTFLTSGAIAVGNLITGLIAARLLGAGGRGEVVAVFLVPNLAITIASLGATQVLSYYLARHRDDRARLIATWLALMLPSSVIATVVVEATLPFVLAAQRGDILVLARLCAPVLIVFGLLAEVFYGAVLARHDFIFYNAVRFAPVAAIVFSFTILWRLDAFSVKSAVLTTSAAYVLGALALTWRTLQSQSLYWPSYTLTRETLSYGLRTLGTNVGVLTNARLDLLIMVGILPAASVGLYSVATNVSWLLITIAAALYSLVVPIAVGHGVNGPTTVIATLHVTLGVAILLAIGAAILADVGITFVYGNAFRPAVPALRLLLPGCVFYAATYVLWAGLGALGRPGRAALAQVPSVLITVVGLILFLRSGGILAASEISSVAYGVAFLTTLVFFQRSSRLPWLAFLPSITSVRQLASIAQVGFVASNPDRPSVGPR